MQPQVGEHRKKLLQENCTARAYPRRSPATHCETEIAEIVYQGERERQRIGMVQVTAEKESWRKPAIWRNPTFAFY